MALAEVAQHFRFAGGIDTKTDEKAVPPTRLLALENGVFSKAISIKKRNGYESIATVADARRFATRGDELLAFSANRSWSLQSNGGDPVDAGPVYSAVGTDRPLVMTGTDQVQPDHASLAGVTVAAWEDSRGGVWWTVLDATTGHVHRVPAQADAAAQSPRCVSAGGNLHIYYAVPSTRSIMAIVVSPATPTAAVTPVQVTDDLDATNPAYDAVPTARNGTPAAIAWFEHATTSIRLGYVTGAGALGSPLSGHPAVRTDALSRGALSPIAIDFFDVDSGAGDVFALAFVNSSNSGQALSYTGELSNTGVRSIYAATDVRRIALCCLDATALMTVIFDEDAIQPSNQFVVVVSGIRPASDSGTAATLRSAGLAARAFAIGGTAFMVVVHETTFFNVYLTVAIGSAADGFSYVGRHVPGSADGIPVDRRPLPSVHVDGSVASFVLPVKTRLISENNDKFTETGVQLFTLDFDNDDSHQAAEFGRGLYLAGGCPSHYDGRQWTELGFNVGPELITPSAIGAGGSMTSSTTYEYIVWYERTDTQGEIHLGPTSPGLLVTMGASDTQVTLSLPTCRLTRGSNVRIGVARSLAAATGDTAEFFRVTSLDPSTAGSPNGIVISSTSTDAVTFVDRMSDDTLRLQEPLYTVGGIFSNDPAPLGAAIARGKTRLFASDPSDGSLVRYSQPLDQGYGVEWPPDLFLPIDPAGGDVTAIGTRDDRVVVWTERAIFAFAGDGPDRDGSIDRTGFSSAQTVPGDVGCSEPASIVLTPRGFMFKSAKGIYLLGNDFSLEYVGAPVEGFNAQRVRRATVLPDRTAVVFLTDSGATLLYDYLFGQWSTFTNHEGLDAAVVGAQYHYLRTDGRVYRETPGQYSDAGVRIRLALETAWIHMLEQLVGFQKFFDIYVLGTWISAHQLGLQYQTDYTPQWTDAVWLDATGESSSTGWITGTGANTIGDEPIAGSEYGDGEYGDGEYGGQPPGKYEWRLDLYEEGESIRFRFQDFEADGFAGASFELTELVITGGAIGNVRRPMTAGRSA